MKKEDFVKLPIIILHLCEHCSVEFECKADISAGYFTVSFQDCPQCEKRNDIWIQVKLNSELPVRSLDEDLEFAERHTE